MDAGHYGGLREGLGTSLVGNRSPSVPRFRVGSGRAPIAPSAGSAASASPAGPRVPARSPRPTRRRGGRDWARKAAGRDLEKPPRLHCSGRGRRRSRFPSRLPAGRSPRGSQALGPAQARGLVQGPRAAAAGAGGTTALPTHTPGELLLKKCYNCSGQSCPTVLSGLWCRDLGNCVLGKRKLDYLGVCRGSALGALGSNLQS